MLRKNRVFVGIYSSARETIARAEDEEGNLIGVASIDDAININFSIKHSWEIIKTIVSMPLKKMGITLDNLDMDINVGIGIKNTELIEACIQLKKLNTIFNNFIIVADGYALLRGAHRSDGATIIIDDGIAGNAIKSDALIKIGGWGFPHADKGSIPWIGLEAISLTIQWIDGFVEQSPLLVEIYKYFNNDISKLVSWAMYSRTNPKEYNFICDIVIDYLSRNDKHAVYLINCTAAEACKLYEKLLERSRMESMPCSLHGQLVPHVKKFITGPLLENIAHPLGDGAQGAISLIKSEANYGKEAHSIASIQQAKKLKYAFTG